MKNVINLDFLDEILDELPIKRVDQNETKNHIDEFILIYRIKKRMKAQIIEYGNKFTKKENGCKVSSHNLTNPFLIRFKFLMFKSIVA